MEVKLNKRLNQHPRIVSSYITNSNIYVLFYLNYVSYTNNFVIDTYDINFQYKKTLTIGTINGNYNYDYVGIFYKGIFIKNNLGAFAFYTKNTTFIPQFRIIEVSSNDYSLSIKFNFELNNPGDFITEPILNDMIKINDKRFSFISCSYDRTRLYIVLFDFYNDNNNIKERVYQINFNSLYSYRIYRELTSISYNNYLAISASVCNTYNPCDKDDINSNYFSVLMIFGYINGTKTDINISNFLSEFDEINNNENNLIDSILKNIIIDNNIFGYEFQKQIKLITIPEELSFYNIETDGKIQVNEGEILKYNYEISQNNNVKMRNRTYYFEFQYIAKESDINTFDQYTIYTENIPNNEAEENFESHIFYGKTIKIEFNLFYELCDTCEYLGISFDDQKCLACNIDNYTNYNGNCYPEGYITEYVTEYQAEYITDYII